MPDHNQAATARTRAALISGAALAIAAVVTALVLATGGASAPHRPTAAQAARARGLAAGHALNVGRGNAQATHEPAVRLGFINGPAAAPGLAGIRLGYFSVQLGLGPHPAQLAATPYNSPAAESAALATGRLDAAYLPPVNAIQAWQQSHGNIRIISGATTRGSTTTAVLAVTLTFAQQHTTQMQALLKGDIQATSLLTTNPTAGHAAAAAELAAIRGLKSPSRKLTASLTATRATCDPGAASVLAQTRTAVTAGQLKPVPTISGIYELTPVNQLLRTAGMVTVPA